MRLLIVAPPDCETATRKPLPAAPGDADAVAAWWPRLPWSCRLRGRRHAANRGGTFRGEARPSRKKSPGCLSNTPHDAYMWFVLVPKPGTASLAVFVVLVTAGALAAEQLAGGVRYAM